MHDAHSMIRTCLLVGMIAVGSVVPGCSQRPRRQSYSPPAVPLSEPTAPRNPQHASPADAYTPTRLEWLVLRLQAGHRKESTYGNFFTIGFAADEPNGERGAVTIYVYYLPPPNQPDMRIVKEAVADAREAVHREAQALGIDVDIHEQWSKWDWTPPQNRPEALPPDER